jgi:hypothetical protein
MYQIKITRHLLERYVQRFCQNISELENIIKIHPNARSFEQNKIIRDLKVEINQKFVDAKETKSHLNNTSALSYLYEKYGYDVKFHFFYNNRILFVTVREDEESTFNYKGITCYDLKKPNIFKNITVKNNFKKHRHSNR